MKDFNALIRDTLPSKNPIGTWQQGKNMLLTKGYKSIANEDGFKFQYLIEGTVIGVIATTKDVVYFSKNDDGTDEIGVVNTDNDAPTYSRVIRSALLGFKYNCPIEGVFIYNYKKELIVAWCDGVKEDSSAPKVLNLTNPSSRLCIDDGGNINCPGNISLMNMFPDTIEGSVGIEYLDNGSIDGEAMYITYAYVMDADTPTYYFPTSLVAYLGTRQIQYNPIRDSIIDKKGIRLSFEDLDDKYTKLKLGIVLETNGVRTAYESYVIDYSYLGKLKIDITSLNNFTTTSVENIITAKAIFDKVNTITKQDNKIHVGYTTSKKPIEFQKYANMLTLKPYKYLNTSLQLPSLMPDEVYAMYIELQRLDGTYTDAFHIPGRVAEVGETDAITEQQKLDYQIAWTDDEVQDYKQFHLFNNCNLDSNPSDSKFGYWENAETYPDDNNYNSALDYDDTALNGSDLRGTPIRYHRIPSIRDAYTKGETQIASPYDESLYGVGVEVSNFADIIPEGIKDQIQGYRISFVKRNSGNSYVKGNWCLHRRYETSYQQGDINMKWAYYDTNDMPDGDSSQPDYFNFNKTNILGNELTKFKPTLDLTYFRANCFVQKSPVNTWNRFEPIEDKYEFGRVTKSLAYVLGDNLANDTQYCDEAINLDIDTSEQGGEYLPIDDSYVGDGMQFRLINITAFSHTVNVYPGFTSTELVVLGRTNNIIDAVKLRGGDVFTSNLIELKLHTMYMQGSQLKQGNHDVIIKGLFSPLSNTTLTHIRDNWASTYYDPVVGDNANPDNIDTAILISKDYTIKVEEANSYNSILDIGVNFTFNHESNFIDRFPYKINRSIAISDESLSEAAIRTFLTESYYNMPNDKGEIIALRGKQRTLFIQHRFTLFVASIKDKLSTPTGEDAYLGTSDLFDRAPAEVLSDDKGYVGSTSKFACLIVKSIYVVVNQVTGQIFTVQEGTEEITKSGNKNWFWDNWDNGLDFYELDVDGEKRRIDNPYVSVGHIVGYDREYDRLLFTKKLYKYIGTDENVVFDGEFYTLNGIKLEFSDTNYFTNLSKTLSYYLDTKSWGFEHDYYPNLTYYTSTGLFSLVNTLNGSSKANIYKHNDKLSKGLYYGQKFPSYVDLIFNSNLEVSKLYKSINWITDTINSNGGNDRFKTITHIAIYNNNQCSGIINLKDNHYDLTRNVQDEWNFNEFRDLVINPSNPILKDNGDINESNLNKVKLWFDKSNFISKFIIVRLIIDNELNDSVYIHEVKVNSVISKR